MSSKYLSQIATFGIIMAIAIHCAAQQPNSLDVVADTIPFDVPYGAPITLERADLILVAAVQEAHKRNWKMNCAVVDSGANLVAFKRMDGAQLASIDISIHKARAAAKFRRNTAFFENAIQKGANYLLTLDDAIASRGGIPLERDGKIVGAIGCSGGTGAQDEVVAKAGMSGIH